VERLQPLLEDCNKIAKRKPGGARKINKEWLARLKKAESSLAATPG
jgi:hypothetical protein